MIDILSADWDMHHNICALFETKVVCWTIYKNSNKPIRELMPGLLY